MDEPFISETFCSCVGVTNSEYQLKRKLSWSLNPVDKLQIEV